MPTITMFLKCFVIAGVLGLAGGTLYIYSGLYPVGADVPHYRLTTRILETLREQSIARSASQIQVPKNLNTPDRLLAGGADYNDMCAGCHLKPGQHENDLTIGLYPSPPNLYATSPKKDNESELKRQFWIIKHGVKASGMPAWGLTHSDERIWDMVAFLQQLPRLKENQYQIMTARGETGTTSHH